MAKLTEAQRFVLGHTPFYGFRPGSNVWSLCELNVSGRRFPGEEVDGMFRGGLLVAEEIDEPLFICKGGDAGPFGEVPDIEATHRIHITPAGRRALESRDG